MSSVTGKVIEPVKEKGSGGLWKISFGVGGRVPEELSGRYTSKNLAQIAIDTHIRTKSKPSTKE